MQISFCDIIWRSQSILNPIDRADPSFNWDWLDLVELDGPCPVFGLDLNPKIGFRSSSILSEPNDLWASRLCRPCLIGFIIICNAEIESHIAHHDQENHVARKLSSWFFNYDSAFPSDIAKKSVISKLKVKEIIPTVAINLLNYLIFSWFLFCLSMLPKQIAPCDNPKIWSQISWWLTVLWSRFVLTLPHITFCTLRSQQSCPVKPKYRYLHIFEYFQIHIL